MLIEHPLKVIGLPKNLYQSDRHTSAARNKDYFAKESFVLFVTRNFVTCDNTLHQDSCLSFRHSRFTFPIFRVLNEHPLIVIGLPKHVYQSDRHTSVAHKKWHVFLDIHPFVTLKFGCDSPSRNGLCFTFFVPKPFR